MTMISLQVNLRLLTTIHLLLRLVVALPINGANGLIPLNVCLEKGCFYMWFHSCNEALPKLIVYFLLWLQLVLPMWRILVPQWVVGVWPSTNPHEVGHWLQVKFYKSSFLSFEWQKDLDSLRCHLLINDWNVLYCISYICTCNVSCKGGM
jgi:hypothetical protein